MKSKILKFKLTYKVIIFLILFMIISLFILDSAFESICTKEINKWMPFSIEKCKTLYHSWFSWFFEILTFIIAIIILFNFAETISFDIQKSIDKFRKK